ncbi:Checkpoint protein hus1 [Sporothrix curviconia]|uniref:Checkpoint protein hus1 n=1 Tax=Sporothrix curviconia TaxID=1260050 RepID=A0ABP0BZ60_9PEZI
MPKHKPKSVSVLGCCERGDHAITRPKLVVKQPTEPCPICHNDVGEATPENIIETWAILPCGHRFGDYCLKVWLGMSKDAMCPICRKKMMHTCGHPTLPRPTSPPVPDAPEAQSEGKGASGISAAGAQQVVAGVQEVSAEEEDDGAMAIYRIGTVASSRRMSPKEAVRMAARRVRSFHKAVRQSFVDDEESKSLDGAAADRPENGAAEEASPAGPAFPTPPVVQQPPRYGLFGGPLNTPPSPKSSGKRRQRRRKLRRRVSQSSRSAAPPAVAAAPAGGAALSRASSQTVILEMLASRSHAQPASTPYFFQMAYPKEVDLTLPCAYCYLTMYREPEDSPYRGGNGYVVGIDNAFAGNAHDIAQSANTIKAAAMIAIRHFFKNLTPGSTFLKAGHYPCADGGVGESERGLSQEETILLAAYWDSWRQVNGKAFGQWWAEQEPRTEPAVEAAAEGWDLANMMF